MSLAIRFGTCSICGTSIFLRVGRDETQVRCATCLGTPIALSLVEVIRSVVGPMEKLRVFEASSRGSVVRFLKRHTNSLSLSEYFPNVPPGDRKGGVQCQDLQALTFEDSSFDLCTSTEVLEHVADDAKAFRELHRVLAGGGTLAFTIPLGGQAKTVERAAIQEGKVIHLLPPEYHGDRLTGKDSVLVFRDYGADIVDRLLAAGFREARLVPPSRTWFGHARTVVVARK